MRNATLWLNPRSTSHTSWANLFEVHACRVWSRMVALPISVAVNVYRGKNQQQMRVVQERIRLARAIEQYVNSQSLGSSSVTLLTYAQIAGAVGGQIQTIGELLSQVGGGSTGITICSHEHLQTHRPG